jgi:signal transduction histidine kinase
LEKNELRLNIDKELLDIMLNNLLSNAIKYNMKNGEIFIEINNDRIKICNTGENNNLNNENIFDRFVKENSKSYGLGLSIVKQICGVCNLNISYVKNSYWHCFVITT